MVETVEERTERVAQAARDIARGKAVPGADAYDVNGRINIEMLIEEIRKVFDGAKQT